MLSFAQTYYIAFDKNIMEFNISNRCLNDYEILFCVEGEGTWTFGDKEYKHAKNQVLLIPPMIKHSCKSNLLPYNFWCIHFDYYRPQNEYSFKSQLLKRNHSLITSFTRSHDAHSPTITFTKVALNLPIITTINAQSMMHLKCNSITELIQKYQYSNIKKVSNILTEIIEELIEMNSLNPHNNDHVDQIISYIQNSYQSQIKLNSVAETIHLSPVYLSRLFKEKCGISFTEYLKLYRIAVAKEMLKHTTDKIEQIALSCGFYDSAHFNHIFLHYENITPSQYRKLNLLG